MSARRNLPRPAAAPGRKSARTKNPRRTAGDRSAGPAAPGSLDDQTGDSSSAPVRRRRTSITTRAIALAVVLLILTISYASSMRIYVEQRQEIAATKAKIAEREAAIGGLQQNLSRWQDDAYVEAQARERLGWVLPGEYGFRVIEGERKAENVAPEEEKEQPAWWDRLLGSLEQADKPPAAPAPEPSAEPTITASTTPKPPADR
ncbi:FtsB family cell division protein [Microlunatus speluncae]|uniref:FtsB family cell division protein n=1 Tax=Microlunatus speluncae TaxID=2594267 RepID=UPI001266746D|nr:septum formation initiator family protein [Microlunatus speluncae]